MEFMYNHAHLPKDQKLLIDINSAASRLFDKLRTFNIEALDISDYNKRYFGGKLASLSRCLQLYSYILAWSLAKSVTPIRKFVFLDYGGGSGMLSLLAKELGVGTVIYNDIYDVSCHDSKLIAESVGNEANYYVQGDIDDVLAFLRTSNLNCNAVASYDVIEHIYDIEYFFERISFFSGGSLTVVMSSGANTFNPLIRRKEMKKQLEVEYKDREKKLGHKERDCLKSFLKVRKEMIYEYLQEIDKELTKEKITQLASNTRGMMEADIQKCVDEYLNTGKSFPGLSHPTNTCDPYTGNWAEHLMDPYYLANILSKTRFRVKILSGYYGHSENIIKRFLGRFLDIAIYISQKQGIRIAPFYTVYGRRD